jgi:ligand-binding sensor domain-containing protein/signal transduction histidine kinase
MKVGFLLPLLIGLFVPHAARADAVRVFDAENGLPHNRVNSIYLDSRGFLWICTDDGLSRSDGHRFVSYMTADGLPHRYVNAILETRSGEYWVATDGGVSRFDPQPGQPRFTTYAPSGPDDARHVNALFEDQDESLLVGTSAGLYRFRARGSSSNFERIELVRSPDAQQGLMVNAIAQDAYGSLWLATNDGLYHRAANKQWDHYGTEAGLSVDGWIGRKPVAFVSSFAQEGNGRLWVAFKGGFGRIARDPKPGDLVLDFVEREQRGLDRAVRALWFGSDGRRWVATESGVSEWQMDSGGASHFRRYSVKDRFPREAFLCFGEDTAGNLWIGTRRSGLVQVGLSIFQTFGEDQGLRFGLDQFLLETRSGQLSVVDSGSRRFQVYRADPRTRRFTAVRPAVSETLTSELHTAIEDHRGSWWFSTASGLVRFPVLGARSDLHVLRESVVGRFFEDSTGDLWISHWPRGGNVSKLARWERRSGLIRNESERLPPDARAGVAAFAQDRSGTIWLGLRRPDGRLLRLKDRRFQPLPTHLGGLISKLFIDSKGRLWAASTESGLVMITEPQSPNPQLHRYTRAQGLSSDEVWCVTEDALGRIYAGTAKGVDRLDTSTGRIVHYYTADGLVHGDIRSALRDHNGDLWFASAHGISHLKPANEHGKRGSRARITGLRFAGVRFPLSEFGETEVGPVRLSSNRNSLQIEFAAASYETQAPLRYQFRLNHHGRADATDGWQDAGVTSTVHLVDLAPGDFTFQVRNVGPDASPGEPASLRFSILEPFWRTGWFQLSCITAIAGAAWWLRARRLRQQIALERVRNAIAMDLHDDIGAGLSRISVIGEALKTRLWHRDDEVQRMLDDISTSSRQLIADMSDIVWSLDPGRDQVGDLASRLRAFGSDLLEMRGVTWTVDAPAETIHQNLPPALRRQCYLVFREGIHNIAKHSGATGASLRVWMQDGSLVGELIDDGCGISTAAGDGHGIPSMRERVRQVGGRIEVTTPATGGTMIRIRIPLSNYA